MKILVAIKRVIDYSVHIRVKADESGIETNNVKMSMNPFDEIAVEEAIRLKEKTLVSEIILVSIGPKQAQETLRTGLAMGGDRAILIETEDDLSSLDIAKILKEINAREMAQLILLGKQAIDNDNNQTGQMLAGLLGWAQGTFVSKIDVQAETVTVVREIDGGLETLRLQLPAVITADLRLNEPRYISLPNIMEAKRKSIQMISLKDLDVDIIPSLKKLKVTGVSKRAQGIKVNSVKELLEKLKNEAQVL